MNKKSTADIDGWWKRHIAAVALSAVALTILTAAFTLWLGGMKPPESSVGYISAGGAVISVVGLLVSLGGFSLTIQQITQAKSAIEAASHEAERIRLSLKTYDATQDATRAEYALKQAKQYFDQNQYEAAGKSYAKCSSALAMIKKNVDGLPDELAEGIDQADTYIENLCMKIDKGITSIDVKQKAEMRTHDRLIRSIQTHLQRNAI
jgi:hypothetical protein